MPPKTILVLDTETTGLPDWRRPVDDPCQPRMVQVAALLADQEGRRLAQFVSLVQPDATGWRIPVEAWRVHGISTEDCRNYGLPLDLVLRVVLKLLHRAEVLVCHNVGFDQRIVHRECLSCKDVMWPTGLTTYCTMLQSTDVCKIPSPRGYKWPRLEEAVAKLLGRKLEGAHDAMVDAQACLDLYRALRKLEQPAPAQDAIVEPAAFGGGEFDPRADDSIQDHELSAAENDEPELDEV